MCHNINASPNDHFWLSPSGGHIREFQLYAFLKIEHAT